MADRPRWLRALYALLIVSSHARCRLRDFGNTVHGRLLTLPAARLYSILRYSLVDVPAALATRTPDISLRCLILFGEICQNLSEGPGLWPDPPGPD